MDGGEGGVGSSPSPLAALQRLLRPPPRACERPRRPRLLDVGAMTNHYLPYAHLIDVLPIDISPQHPSVLHMVPHTQRTVPTPHLTHPSTLVHSLSPLPPSLPPPLPLVTPRPSPSHLPAVPGLFRPSLFLSVWPLRCGGSVSGAELCALYRPSRVDATPVAAAAVRGWVAVRGAALRLSAQQPVGGRRGHEGGDEAVRTAGGVDEVERQAGHVGGRGRGGGRGTGGGGGGRGRGIRRGR